MNNTNPLKEKSYALAIEIVKLCKKLATEKNTYDLIN